MQMTRKQYDALLPSYRGTVDGQPYALYMDDEGRTVYGPVEITDSPPLCYCGARMVPAGIGQYPYDCIAKDKHPLDMVYIGCEAGHTGWTHTPQSGAEPKPTFSAAAREWLQMTLRLYDARENGFGVSAEVWQEVRGRGWYRTVRGWLSLTEKGRREIPQYIHEAEPTANPNHSGGD
jgi:hypothetical protein